MTAQTVHPAGNSGCDWLMPAAEMAALASGNGAPGPDAMPVACFPDIAVPAPGVDASLIHAARDLTNALLHALPAAGHAHTGWPVRLGLLQPGRGVMCAVADPSRVAPVLQQPEHLGETGRGLHVIAALSDQWGCTVPTDMGKVMWAMFSAPLAPPVPALRSRRDPRRRQAAGATSR